MIPKIIHYCWFGQKPLPKLATKCIASWHKFLPDYQIIQWNKSNFDINSFAYTAQAAEAKKWAFVTDVVRLYALVNYGGIYLDADVEILKPLDDILRYKAVSGFESSGLVPTGLMASEKGFPLFNKWLQDYKTLQFFNKEGIMDLTTNTQRITAYLQHKGLLLNNTEQTIEDFTLLPKDFFSPYNYVTKKIDKTSNSYAVHHFMGSWCEPTPLTFQLLKGKTYDFLYRNFGSKTANFIKKLWRFCKIGKK